MTRFMLPGWHGSGPDHWQRLWAAQDPAVRVVEQEDWSNPRLDRWVERLDQALDGERDALLIGHSLGVILVAHYASLRPDAPIAGALLVAPGDADLHAPTNIEIATFAPVPRQRLRFPTIMVLSRTDPHMTFERSTELARDLGSEIVDIGDAGHINVDSGFGPWPLGFELADRLQHQNR